MAERRAGKRDLKKNWDVNIMLLQIFTRKNT